MSSEVKVAAYTRLRFCPFFFLPFPPLPSTAASVGEEVGAAVGAEVGVAVGAGIAIVGATVGFAVGA
jgi:hypothetical protein